MRLYVDDDSVDPNLIRLLRRDGHDIQVPADVGLSGSTDQVHLAHAIRDGRAPAVTGEQGRAALALATRIVELMGHRP